MKIKRHKKVHKTVNFYVNNFGFRQPFQLLIDGTFCFAALKNKVNIQEQLPKYLQAELKLLTTQCVVLETERLGPKVHGAMLIVKRFSVHKCGHEKKPVSGSECLRSMVGKRNENRYIIATQDRELQEQLRGIPGAPIMYLHRVTPILENPSETTAAAAKEQMDSRFDVNNVENSTLTKLRARNGLDAAESGNKKKRKKKSGPNPLSCLKTKKKASGNMGIQKNEPNVQKRKRIRIPKHVREEMLRNAD